MGTKLYYLEKIQKNSLNYNQLHKPMSVYTID